MEHFRDLSTLVDRKDVLKKLKRDGYFYIEGAYDANFCARAINFIDNYHDQEDVNFHYGNSEIRIWHAQDKNPEFKSFVKESNLFFLKLFEKSINILTLLAIRNKKIESENSSFLKGRWHIDSFTSQVKLFLFLTDTSERAGPFEFIPRTHTLRFKIRHFFAYFFKLNFPFTFKLRKYQSLKDSWVDKLISRKYPSKPFICKAGTVLVVDTTAIHRARPCLEGNRYAIVSYYPSLFRANKVHDMTQFTYK